MTSSPTKVSRDRLTCRVFTKSEAPELLQKVLQLRHLVYKDEQQLPEWVLNDESDDTILHVVALLDADSRAGAETVVGAARLQPVLESDGSRTAKVERVLVARELRESGVGALVMQVLLDEARQRGYRGAVLESVTFANGFYKKVGFHTDGDEFVKMGLPHYIMRMTF